MHEPQQRPHLVTAVGLIGIFAGMWPILELGGVLVSPSFSAFFLPLVQKIMPVNTAVILALFSAPVSFCGAAGPCSA